jgi:serine protease Do
VVLEFDGKQIDRMRSLPRLVAETAIGKAVQVKLWRKGKIQDVQVTLGELPEDEQLAELGQPAVPQSPTGRVKVDALGLTLAAITPELKTEYSLPEAAKGVVVTEVVPDSPAAEESLQAGDLLVEVSQEPVACRRGAHQDQPKPAKDKKTVLLLIDRQGDPALRGLADEDLVAAVTNSSRRVALEVEERRQVAAAPP